MRFASYNRERKTHPAKKLFSPENPATFIRKSAANMSSVQLQHAIFSALPQLSESQLGKLVEFINSMLAIQKPQAVIKAVPGKMRKIKIFTDDSFDLEQDGVYAELPFHKTFVVQAKAGVV
jgi:hypothetical protein